MGIFTKTKKNGESVRTGVDLSQVIRGMQHAVNEAQRTLETHHIKSLLRFFYKDGTPKTVDLHLGGTKHIDIPLVTLANHSSLKIEELEMEFKASIQDVTLDDSDELRTILRNASGAQSPQDSSSDGTRSEESDMAGDDSAADESSAVFSIAFSSVGREGANPNTVNVRIKFQAIDQPEGLSRIIDEYNKRVAPYDVTIPAPGDAPAFVFEEAEPEVEHEPEPEEPN